MNKPKSKRREPEAHKAEGLSLQAIADKLNAEGHTTRRGKPWNQVQVSRVLERAEVACV